MKKLVVAIAVGMVCVGAFAQGRVVFANTSRLVYIDSGADMVAYAGGAVAALDGASLVADLYVGSTENSLVYSGISAASWIAAAPGAWTAPTANLPSGYAGGTATKWWFQVEVRPSTDAPAALAPLVVDSKAGYGYSELFQAYASSSPISANNLVTTGSPSFSTWAVGSTPILGTTTALAPFGAIAVIVPEPASFAQRKRRRRN